MMHDAYKSYVYIVNDQGVVERRDVTLGNTVNNEQCFSSGVKEGKSSSSTACTRCVPAPR
ncbi:hypothetical protein M5E88_18530 [Akkermansia muciniphila]|nr:hypothetical protein M5E88_18530 [Akkermansia muciniphila]